MLLLIANTYTQSYGVELTLFGIFDTREDCIKRMEHYNNVEVPKIKELISKVKSITDDVNFNPDEYKNLCREIANYGANECYPVFEFDLSNPDKYIKEYKDKPLYLGGYAE